MKSVYAFATSAFMMMLHVSAFAAEKTPTDKAWRTLSEANVEVLMQKIEVFDEPMEMWIKLTSRRLYKQNTSFISYFAGARETDNYLRAFVDKKTGQAAYQFVFTTRYIGQYEYIRRANYLTADGPVTAEVNELQNELRRCDAKGCEHYLAVAVDVPRSVLDWAASRNVNDAWYVRLVSVDEASDRGVNPKEIAALLAKTDAEIARIRS
jgi:hypothetical protein